MEVGGVVVLAEVIDGNATGRGGMDKLVVLEIDADVGHMTITAGDEKDQVTLAQVIQVDDTAVHLKHLGAVAVQLDSIDLLIDLHDHA